MVRSYRQRVATETQKPTERDRQCRGHRQSTKNAYRNRTAEDFCHLDVRLDAGGGLGTGPC